MRLVNADSDLDHLVEVVLSGFSTVKWLFWLLFHTQVFGRKSLCTAQHKEYVSPPWGWTIHMNDLEFCIDLSFHHHLFIQSFISLWAHGYLFYILSHNPILLYLFSSSTCSCFGYWGSFQLTPVSLWHSPSLCVLNTFLLSDTTWFSRLTLYGFCFSPKMNLFSRSLIPLIREWY